MVDTEQTSKDVFSVSSYTPFQLAALEASNKIKEYEQLLENSNYMNDSYRAVLIDKAEVVYSKTRGIGFSIQERREIESIISDMRTKSSAINNIKIGFAATTRISLEARGVLENEYLTPFERLAKLFLDKENDAMQNHGGMYKIKQKTDQIEMLVNIFSVRKNNYFYNKFGIPISLQMEAVARAASLRVLRELNNTFVVEGELGYGKTTFGWALGSTMAEMLGVPFVVRDVFTFNENAQYIEEKYRNAIPRSIIIDDEFGNQANRRRSLQGPQVDFMDRLKLLRYKGITTIGCWKDYKELDSQLDVHGIFTITETGTAQLRTFNKNKYARSKEFVPHFARNMVAYTQEDQNRIIEDYDDLNLMKIPFYKIPQEIWDKEYMPMKQSAGIAGRMGTETEGVRKKAEELYYRFLVTLPDNCIRITSQMILDFSKKENFELTFNGLVKKIANGIGRRPRDMIKVGEGLKEAQNFYIDVDEYVDKFIKRIKAAVQGIGMSK